MIREAKREDLAELLDIFLCMCDYTESDQTCETICVCRECGDAC